MIRSGVSCMSLVVASFVLAAAGLRDVSAPDVGRVSSAQPMLEPRSGHSATLLPDGRVLIAGGMRRNQDFYKSAELYDPASGRFLATGEMSLPRVGQIAVLLSSGKVLVAGGWVGHTCTDSAELYDPATGKFTLLPARMTTHRGDARATLLLNGNVLITGGADHDSPRGIISAAMFSLSDLSFHALPPMHFARVYHTATLLPDGRVLVVGGRGDKVNAVAELFDPQRGSFTETGSLATARYKHTAGLLPDGRVLVAGGSDERDWSGSLNSAEIYDSETGKFSPVSSRISARFKLPQEAVATRSGELLIAGGSSRVELFDPRAGKFVAATGEISGPWHFMSETRLQDGRVLFAGGYANDDRATSQAWIFKP